MASEEEVLFLTRSARATRGKRMTKLLDEEIELDEQFWNQAALKEDEDDAIYQEEPEVADEFDSDFDDDEPDPHDEEENDGNEVVRVRKRLVFPGKSASNKKSKKKALTAVQKKKPIDVHSPDRSPSILLKYQDVPDDPDSERVIRKSTRTLVVVRQAERDAIRAALQATMKPIKRKKEGEEKRMTQEEMLLEAAQTEVMNLRNLERVLAREEEVKKRAVVQKQVYDGPQLRYYSKDGKNYLEFMNGLSFLPEICSNDVPYPERVVCAVTSIPARYRDPLTGLPYSTKEAFKIIRQRLSHAKNTEKDVDEGPLLDLVSGQGFTTRRKRSMFTPQIRNHKCNFFP